MNPAPDKCPNYFWLAALLLGAIFFPLFIVTFGAHTDGYYAITPKGNWLGNPEGAIIFMQGRPLLTFLTSFIGWFTHSAEAFTTLRVLSFLTKIWLTYLIYSFCCKISIRSLWSLLIAFCFVLLPGNIINVIWVANGFPSSLALLCGVLSYLWLTDGFTKRSNLVYSGLLFLTSLLTYQPVAMIVFSLMFIRALFSKNPSWTTTRNTIIKETFFYGSILVFYWLLVKYLIIPVGQNILHLSGTNMGTYKMDLAGDLSKKYSLVIDLLRSSLIGTWDTVLYKSTVAEWRVIAVFWAMALGSLMTQKKGFFKGPISIPLQRTIACIVLFLLSNTPSLMAVNSTSILGYRTFLPSGLIGLVLTIYYFKYCSDTLSSRRAQTINNCLLGIYVLLMISVATWVIHQSVRNYSKEYSYINKSAAQIDYKKIDQIVIVFNRPGDTVIGYDLPFEFGYMATNSGHIRYIFDKYASRFNKQLTFKEVFIDWPVYADDHTEIIDLTSLRPKGKNNYALPGKKIKIETTASDDKNVSVQQISGGPDDPKFLFKEDFGSKESYWLIPPGESQAGFILSFINSPQMLIDYKLGAYAVRANGRPVPFSWQVQGSNDKKSWMDISKQEWNNPAENSENTPFALPNDPSFIYVRFLLTKNDTADILAIKTLELYSFTKTS